MRVDCLARFFVCGAQKTAEGCGVTTELRESTAARPLRFIIPAE